MIIRAIRDKDNPYFQLNRRAVEDPRISLKAVGIHAYIMSKPDRWEAKEHDIAQRHSDGKTAVRMGIKELIQYGYVTRVQLRKNGKVAGARFDTYETPELNPYYREGVTPKTIVEDLDSEPTKSTNLITDNLNTENLISDNRRHSNNISSSKELDHQSLATPTIDENTPPFDENPLVAPDVGSLSRTLQNMGIGLSQYTVDQYMELVEECGMPAVLAGLEKAAANGKQHRMKYVFACIRGSVQNQPAERFNGTSTRGPVQVVNPYTGKTEEINL